MNSFLALFMKFNGLWKHGQSGQGKFKGVRRTVGRFEFSSGQKKLSISSARSQTTTRMTVLN